MSTTALATPTQSTIIAAIYPFVISANLSLIGCVLFVKRCRRPLSSLQVYLACSDIIRAIGPCIGTNIPPLACTVMGTIAQFSYVASTSWNLMISVYCYMTIFKNPAYANNLWLWYHTYSWGLALLLTVLMFVGAQVLQRGPVLGVGPTACWINSNYLDLRVYLFYVPIWIHFGYTLFIYGHILWKVDAVLGRRSLPGGVHVQESAAMVHQTVGPPAADVVVEGALMRSSDATIFYEQHQESSCKGGLQRHHRHHDSDGSDDQLEEQQQQHGSKQVSEVNQKLLVRAGLIAVGFLVSFGPASVARILAMHSKHVPHWLTLWSTAGMASSSLWNVSVFFTSWFWRECVAWCCCCFCWRRI
ncbi:hypothetical protein BDR26DRAFT_875460 [Obelidium mucronatum]|nr:hypothetical protein BDR26DRAFT_875460 [Obelidium mucronatum]